MSVDRPVQPGDFFLARISGTTGFLIMLGQALVGDASRYTHAGIIMPDGRVFAAQPGGARYDDVSTLTPPYVVSSGRVPLTDAQRADVLTLTEGLEGTPYSFLDYLYLALHRFGLRWGWVERQIETSAHMICSQLVDEVYRRAGVHIFTDDRTPQNVTPGDLANVLIEEW